jgi:cellulose synthase/poly-beta-1,6-N-acetylglucosamine synthase-like glycosyltransferase
MFMSQVADIIMHMLFLLMLVTVGYLLILAIAGRIAKTSGLPNAKNKRRIAVLITTYKEDLVIEETVRRACTHNYPAAFFRVFVAADRLQKTTLEKLSAYDASIHPLHFAEGSKARSLNHLLNEIDDRDYDIALILDGDNIMKDDCLELINDAFENGAGAVQCHRTAKNLNTNIAILDALSEEVNNFLFRQAPQVLGLSASTIGSGMAFPFALLRSIYNKPGILSNPACDREVDYETVKRNVSIHYVPQAIVYDEKVSKQEVFQNQRKRWLESQLSHIAMFFRRSERPAVYNKNYWHKLFINLIPPRSFLLLAFALVFIAYALDHRYGAQLFSLTIKGWIVLFICYVLVFVISIPRKFYSLRTLYALLSLPVVFVSFFVAAMKMKPGRKEFIHTPKTFRDGEL